MPQKVLPDKPTKLSRWTLSKNQLNLRIPRSSSLHKNETKFPCRLGRRRRHWYYPGSLFSSSFLVNFSEFSIHLPPHTPSSRFPSCSLLRYVVVFRWSQKNLQFFLFLFLLLHHLILYPSHLHHTAGLCLLLLPLPGRPMDDVVGLGPVEIVEWSK